MVLHGGFFITVVFLKTTTALTPTVVFCLSSFTLFVVVHPMQTRSKSGIVKKKVFLTTLQESGGVDLSLGELATYKMALKVPIG